DGCTTTPGKLRHDSSATDFAPPPARRVSWPGGRALPSARSPPMPAPAIPPEVWSGDLRRAALPPRWVWHGYLAAGAVTLLTSQWKSGKTTLLAVLLARLHHGGQLAGAAVAAGKAIVVSEEPAALWANRGQALCFGPHL